MNCLFFDIASHTATFACIAGNDLQSFVQKEERIGDENLIPSLKECLEQAGWSYGDLDQIACVIGPGGFTTLRIAVAAANTLAHELKIPTAGVHLSDVYFARAKDDCVWVHSTKKDQLFIRSKNDAEPRVIAPEELPEGTHYCGEFIEDHQKIAEERSMQKVGLLPLKEVLPTVLSGLSFGNELLLPWYGRSW